MLERIKAFFRSLFAKSQKPDVVQQAANDVAPEIIPPPVGPPNPTDPDKMNEAQYRAWRARQPVGRQAYIPTWEQKQLRDQRVSESQNTPGRDRSGGDLNDGTRRVNHVSDGGSMTYYFTVKPGMEFVRLLTHSHSNSGFARKEFTVTGPKSFSGSSFGSEGQNAGPPIIHQNLPPGDYTVVVRYFGVYGGAVATQCQMSQTQLNDHPGYTHY